MLNLISSITPPTFSRAWFTSAHPDLPIIATCFSDKSVRIYSLTSFTLLSTISGGHKRSVRTCAWKPNLKTESVLATGSFDATVGIWRNLRIAPTAGGNLPADEDLAETRFQDEDDNDDEEEWRFAIVLEGHESEVKSISWSAGGNLLATSSRDKSVWVWEEVAEDDFETIAVLQEHEGDVKCAAWHPEEELVASGSYDTEIRLWRGTIGDV
jgi:cytosolic iron-sulfur protein assembly protein CIAO1